MSHVVTVNILKTLCEEQIKKGHGDKVILISSDDEANEYHTLYFGFTDDPKLMKEARDYGMFHDNNELEEVVLLG